MRDALKHYGLSYTIKQGNLIFLLLIWLIVLLGYKYQDKSLLNRNDIKNEVFTEDFFEDLIQVQSVTSSSSISKWKDLHTLHLLCAKFEYIKCIQLDIYGGDTYDTGRRIM